MIYIMSKQSNEIVTTINVNTSHELSLIDDVFKQSIELATDTYTFSITKHPYAEKIKLGDYVVAKDKYKNNAFRIFEMITKDETKDDITIYSESAGIDLINETVSDYTADKSYSIEHYFNIVAVDSGWMLKTDITTKRKLEWNGIEKSSKRLRDIAKWFDAELYYTVDIENNKIKNRYVNIVSRIGKNNGVYLTLDKEIDDIKKTEDISELVTAVRVISNEKDLSLSGYSYDDGRYFVSGETICDRVSSKKWKRQKFDSDDSSYHQHGYIVYVYESGAKTKEALFQEGLEQLKKRNEPHIKYDITVNDIPDNVEIGDTIRVVAHGYYPKLKLEARVTEVERSLFTNKKGRIVIESGRQIAERLDEKVKKISELLKEKLYHLDSIEPKLSIVSTNGSIFKDGQIQTTLIATVNKNFLDVTHLYQIRWKRVSTYNTSSDSDWNIQHLNGTKTLDITIADVDQEATFICECYKDNVLIAKNSIVIKDFIVGKYKQPTRPLNAKNGDFWVDTSTPKNELYILKEGQWIKSIQRTYFHTAYANSADGRLDFSLTDTTNKRYMGTYSDVEAIASTDPRRYKWVDMVGTVNVGARNLLLGTKSFTSNWDVKDIWTPSGDYLGLTVLKKSGQWHGIRQPITVEAGETYTFSAYVRASQSTQIGLYMVHGGYLPQAEMAQSYKYVSIHTVWQKVQHIFTVTKSGQVVPRIEQVSNAPNTDIYICGFKLEKGNIATDWSPAPEDLEQTTLTLKEDYDKHMQTIINTIASINVSVEQALTKDDLEDLTGKYTDLAVAYNDLKQTKETIEGLGQRVSAYELNLQQSQFALKAIATNFSFSEDGVIIGRDGHTLQLRQTHEKLSFIDGGKEVAYINNQKLYVLSGEFTESLLFANHIAEKLGKTYTIFNYVGGA